MAHLPASEIREALGYRRAAGESFGRAWASVLEKLPATQQDDLWPNAWQWRLAYERRGPASIAKLLDAIEGAGERDRFEVVG